MNRKPNFVQNRLSIAMIYYYQNSYKNSPVSQVKERTLLNTYNSFHYYKFKYNFYVIYYIIYNIL